MNYQNKKELRFVIQATVDTLKNYDGETVTLRGWLYNKRKGGKIKFVMLRDGTGFVQVVLSKSDVDEQSFLDVDRATQESSIEIMGVVRADKRAPGGYEITGAQFRLLSLADEYPIQPKEHGTGFLMDHRHLWLRSKRQHAILRVRDSVIRAIREFFHKEGFLLVDTPIFTPAACEGTTTLFPVEYFGETVYLTQSGQLYNEANAAAFGKVYCFGPTFRAEKSKTRRHLTEFWMVEPEWPFCDIDENMDVQEAFVSFIVQTVLKECPEELERLERDVSLLEKVVPPFPRISYDEAIDILHKEGVDIEWGQDFGGDDETVLSAKFDKPILVHRYPFVCKAFYMKQDPQRPEVALCIDMLAPEGYGEIIGGGQREDDLEALRERIKAHNLPEESFKWYLDLRRYGSFPHGGFGLGVERTVAWICGIKHVRETIPFPRLIYRTYP